MSENENEVTKKAETIAMYPSTLPEGQEDVDYLFYGVQGVNEEGAKCKAMVAYPVPKTDEEAVERYNLDLAGLIAAGVRSGIATRPNYPLEFEGRTTDKEGKVIDRGIITQAVVEKCQALADGYKVGSRPAGVSKDVKEVKAIASEMGMTMAEMKAELLELKRMREEG